MDPLHDFMTGLPTISRGYKTMSKLRCQKESASRMMAR